MINILINNKMIEDGGGLKSTFELVKESISPKFKVVKYNNLSHIFKIIVSKKESAFLFIGYADSHIIYSFTLSLLSNAKIIYLPDLFFYQMIRLNRLKLILCQLYGNFKISSDKFKNTYL